MKQKRLRPEEDLQKTIVHWLKLCAPSVLISASLNGVWLGGGKFACLYAHNLKLLGQLRGEPDLRLMWWPAKTLYLELKIKPNKVSPDQAACMADLTNFGFPCEVVHSLDEAIELFKHYGMPMRASF